MATRLLHIIPGLGHGGAEHQLVLNVAWTSGERFEHHVCHLFPRTILAPELRAAGAMVHYAGGSGPLGFAGRIRRLVRLVRSLKIDLIHSSNFEGEVYGALVSRLTRVPAVTTLTNSSDDEVRLIDNPRLNQAKLTAVRWMRKAALQGGYRRYVAISQHVKESAVDHLGLCPERVQVIYRGTPPELAAMGQDEMDRLRGELGLEGVHPVVLTAGRLVPQKGQRYLLQAIPEIRRTFPEARLLVAGTGFLEQELRELAARLGVADAVRFLGRRDDIPVLMAMADLFVFPSVYEGLGVALLEAATLGKPCIATRVGPLPELLTEGESGLLVPPQDPGELARAVVRLAGDRDLQQRLGARAARDARERFSIERAATQLADLYEGVLSDNGSREPAGARR